MREYVESIVVEENAQLHGELIAQRLSSFFIDER